MSSRKKAIESHCKECIFDKYGGNGKWRVQTEKCTNLKCYLFPYRPRTTKVSLRGRKAIKACKNGENPSIQDIEEEVT